jgi:4-amino-4-deoxy-L-arabinose transferase-like glycosyltransferase
LLFACFVLAFIGPALARLFLGTTEVIITRDEVVLSAQVDGSRLDVPPASLDAGQVAEIWQNGSLIREVIAPPAEGSSYRQPAQPGPLSWIGEVGEWVQGVWPLADWRLEERPSANVARYTLFGSRSTARLDLVTPGGDGYALVVRPEHRHFAWWRLEGGQPVEQLAGSVYRPAGLSSLGNAAAELIIVAWAASILVLFSWLLKLLIAWLIGVRQGDDRRKERSSQQPVASSRSVLSPPERSDASVLTLALRRWLSRPYLPAIALFLAGTVASAAACLMVLDGIPHVQDDVGYLFQGKIFSLGRSAVPVPPGAEFFEHSFIQMYEGRWFAKYPPGYPLLLVPAIWAGMPWLVNALSAGVSLALVYAAGLRMFGVHVAAWAGLLGLVSPWVIFMSGSYMSHPTTMMWVALFLYALVLMRVQGSRFKVQGSAFDGQGVSKSPARNVLRFAGYPLLAGFAIGMAFITREWTALGIGVGAMLWALGDLALVPGERLRRLARYTLVIVGFVPPLLFLLYENRQLMGDWLRTAQELVGSYDRPGFGPGHGDAEGHTPALGVFNALVYGRSLATLFNGWPGPFALATVFLGLFAWVGEGRRKLGWDALLWLSTAGLVGAYFLWWSATTIFGPRYWYEAMPFLLLIAGRGLDLLGRWDSGFGMRGARSVSGSAIPQSAMRWLVPGFIFGVFTVNSLSQSLPNQVNIYKDYNDVSTVALENAEAARLKNALVFVELHPARPRRDYGKVFFANDPLLRGDIVYARDLGAERNESLMEHFPGREPYWLPLEGPPQPGFGPEE